MNRLTAPSFLLCAISLLAPLPASAAPISTVLVGNPGNSPDQLYPTNNPNNLQFGAVANAYRVGTYEVTNSQYAEFLTAKATSDPLGLYNTNMGLQIQGGITQGGVSGGYTYAVKSNMGDKPVNFVTWYDAIRFSNWMHNGQGNGDTETGAYTLGALGSGGIPTNPANIVRNSGATWFLPSENEWYKAAYFDPRATAQGGPAGNDNYWLYPTSSDSLPTIATANSVGDISNPAANVVNYNSGADWNGLDGNVTTVGSAGPLSEGFYGTSDQGGNVFEWNEATFNDGTTRIVRGGAWGIGEVFLYASYRAVVVAADDDFNIGFRVANVPEPSSVVLAALGLFGLAARGWRRRKRAT